MKLFKTIIGTLGALLEIGATWLYVIFRCVTIIVLSVAMCILSGSAIGMVYSLVRFGFTISSRVISSFLGM